MKLAQDGLIHGTLLSGPRTQFDALDQQWRVYGAWDRYDQRIGLKFNEIDAITIVETDVGKRTGKRDPATARTVYTWTRPGA